MEKRYFDILILSQGISKTIHLKIRKEAVKVFSSLLAFALLSTTFLFCDYIQIKKKIFALDQERQEVQVRRLQIQLLSVRIGDLEKQLSKMRDFDRRIRIVANLERGQETIPFIGMGGFSPSVIQGRLNEEKNGSFESNPHTFP